MSAEKPAKRNNNVMVSLKHSRYVFADVTKHLLAEGEKEVELSALGNAINEAVAVAELLKGQNLCTVTKINTARLSEGDLQQGDGDRRSSRRNTDRISITVVKTSKFQEVYDQQKKEREAKAAEKGADKK